jgi:hypothetical protein
MSKDVDHRIAFANKKKRPEAEIQILVRNLIDFKSKMYYFKDRPLRVWLLQLDIQHTTT